MAEVVSDYYRVADDLPGTSMRFPTSADEDVFGKYYADIAKQLPPEVQDLFYGEYGIGHRP